MPLLSHQSDHIASGTTCGNYKHAPIRFPHLQLFVSEYAVTSQYGERMGRNVNITARGIFIFCILDETLNYLDIYA